MDIVLVAAPTLKVVSLVDAKRHLVVDFTDDDTLIEAYIDAATDHLDGYTGILGRALMSQQWAVQAHEWRGCFTIPMQPVKGVALKYYDEANVEHTVDETFYRLSGQTLWLDSSFTRPALYGRGDAVSAEFTLGETDVAKVPAAIKAALLLMVGGLYANRENIADAQTFGNAAFDMLVSPYRRAHP